MVSGTVSWLIGWMYDRLIIGELVGRLAGQSLLGWFVVGGPMRSVGASAAGAGSSCLLGSVSFA